MNILIVNWPINDVGGINSWIENIKLGFELQGHSVSLAHMTNQTRYECDPVEKLHKRRMSILPGRHYSYRDGVPKDLPKADLVVFAHPSPHPTQNQLSRDNPDGWMDIYRHYRGTPRIVVFHDEKWRKTNDWFIQVRGECELAVAAQHRFLPCVEDWARDTCKTMWSFFPMPDKTIPDVVPTGIRSRGLIFTQWLKWKNHRRFLPIMRQIKTPIDILGGGIEYHYAKAEGELDFLVDFTTEEVEETEGHAYHGFVPYEDCMEALSRAKFAIDLSTRGYTNMSHWEPLWRGTPSFIEESVLNDPFCEIPRDLAEPFTLDESLIERIDSFRPDPAKLQRARLWMRDHCGPRRVACSLLEALP